MATKEQVVNLALTRLGVRTVTADELTTLAVEPARRVAAIWDMIRQAVLRDHDWGFASRNVALALDSTVTPGWTYTYRYPADCMCARALMDELQSTQSPFAKVDAGDHVAIACNVANATLRYTADVIDVALWDAAYVDAFAWRLASELAKALAGDDAKMASMIQAYMLALSRASVADAREGCKPDLLVEAGNPYYEVR